jgi:hypothetical protein
MECIAIFGDFIPALAFFILFGLFFMAACFVGQYIFFIAHTLAINMALLLCKNSKLNM